MVWHPISTRNRRPATNARHAAATTAHRGLEDAPPLASSAQVAAASMRWQACWLLPAPRASFLFYHQCVWLSHKRTPCVCEAPARGRGAAVGRRPAHSTDAAHGQDDGDPVRIPVRTHTMRGTVKREAVNSNVRSPDGSHVHCATPRPPHRAGAGLHKQLYIQLYRRQGGYTHQIQNHENPHIHEVSAKDPDQHGHTRVTHLRPHNPLLVHRASAHMAPWSSTSRTPSTRRRPAWQHTRLAAAANTRQATATQAACWSLHSYFSHGLSHDGGANCSAFASCL